MAGSMVYRLRVADPDAEHIATFREAMRQIQALQDNRGYQWIAGFHGAPGGWCWHHQRFRGTQTQARLFLPWHRAYLYTLEQALQDRIDGVALPWWDWSEQRGIPPAYDLPQVDNQQNPLHHFDINLQPPLVSQPIQHATRRNPSDPARLPPPHWLPQLLDINDFETFNDISESLHDQIHGWVGGDMGVVETAAFDPIFWAHHCMIDRLWSIWQVRHGADRFPQALLDVPLRPFEFTVRDVLDTQALGYEYALQSTPIPLGDLADA